MAEVEIGCKRVRRQSSTRREHTRSVAVEHHIEAIVFVRRPELVGEQAVELLTVVQIMRR